MKKIIILLLISFPIIMFAQNVGIGTTIPSEKLEINNPLRSTLKISSSRTTDTTELLLSNKTVNGFGTFYTDYSIKSVREDGLFFSSQSDFASNNSANSLVISPQGNVGIGKALPLYKLDVNGDINTTGMLRLNGNAGTAGQVLTSNGAATPVWENAAFGNTTRFGLSFTHTTTTGHSVAPLTLLYNLNTTNVTIGPNSFTINKTGLYHFDIILNASILISGSVGFINFYFANGGINFLKDEPVLPYTGASLGKVNRSFSFQTHVTAGTVLSFGGSVSAGSSGLNTGWVYCHLIND